MTKRYALNWAIWIAIVNGLYCGLYAASPLGGNGLIWVTYVAYPIYFLSGAKRKDLASYLSCSILGVIWGLVFLWCINLIVDFNVGGAIATGLGVLIIEFLLIFIHFAFTGNTIFGVVPAIFGGVAVTFSTGGKDIVVLMATLILGVLLALLSNEGKNLLKDDGSWKTLGHNNI